jgi:hypothetical protein
MSVASKSETAGATAKHKSETAGATAESYLIFSIFDQSETGFKK